MSRIQEGIKPVTVGRKKEKGAASTRDECWTGRRQTRIRTGGEIVPQTSPFEKSATPLRTGGIRREERVGGDKLKGEKTTDTLGSSKTRVKGGSHIDRGNFDWKTALRGCAAARKKKTLGEWGVE